MRERMKERLSVALVTGEVDVRRRELEVVRYPVLRDLGARVKLWTVPRQGHAMPVAAVIEDVLVWLELARPARRLLAVTNPVARMPESSMPAADLWARGVYDEATARLKDARHREVGVLQLEGVLRRWRGSAAAQLAAKALDKHDEEAKVKWQAVYDRKQLEYAYLEAKALDEYLALPMPVAELLRKPAMLRELAALWELVEKHGPDTAQAAEATRRLEELRKATGR
jgi:hypothetical protein